MEDRPFEPNLESPEFRQVLAVERIADTLDNLLTLLERLEQRLRAR